MEVSSQLRAPTTLPGERTPGTYRMEDWMDPRASLDLVVMRKKSHYCLCRELNSGRPNRSLVTILTGCILEQ